MARIESEREDLLREATALTPRAEFLVSLVDPPRKMPVVVGFRAGGSASFFFDAEPVYHFNSHRHLRRAYADGLLYKAAKGVLISMHRVRTEGEVQLQSRQLSLEELGEFAKVARENLQALCTKLECGDFELVGRVPEDEDLVPRVVNWLSELEKIQIASSPRLG